MRAAALWPAAVVGALVVTVGANIAIFVLANDGDRAAVEPHYYERAVAWDSTMAEEARSAATGWEATVTLSPAGASRDGAVLRVRLVDRESRPVDGAIVRVEAIHNLDEGRRVSAVLGPRGNGAYEDRVPLERRGLWELRLRADRGSEHYEADLRRDLADGPTNGGSHGTR